MPPRPNTLTSLDTPVEHDLRQIERREWQLWTLTLTLLLASKIDRSTIVQARSSRQFLTFLHDLVLALRNYAKEGIIAEGIETHEELQVVRDLGIETVQGYLMGRPQELDPATDVRISRPAA